MIVYRCLTNSELMALILDKEYNKAVIKGGNTFHYDDGVSYKHFFMFGDHANYFKNNKAYHFIGQYVIPDEIIVEKGFGFYSAVKTMRNDKLYYWYMPLPEIIIKQEDFKKDYLYNVEPGLYNDYVINRLDNDDNIKFNEPIIDEFRLENGIFSYLDYSYADVYYEMVYQLARKNNMDLNHVAKLLKNIDLYEEIKKYYEDNTSFFRKQTKQYVKTQKKSKF